MLPNSFFYVPYGSYQGRKINKWPWARKPPGPDGPRKLDLCLAIEGVSSILAKLEIRKLLMEWKWANAVSIFKSSSNFSASNYRPASSTCICCKMLQHIVLHSMSSKVNGILLPRQHGLRKGLSCASQLLTTTWLIIRVVDQGEMRASSRFEFLEGIR